MAMPKGIRHIYSLDELKRLDDSGQSDIDLRISLSVPRKDRSAIFDIQINLIKENRLKSFDADILYTTFEIGTAEKNRDLLLEALKNNISALSSRGLHIPGAVPILERNRKLSDAFNFFFKAIKSGDIRQAIKGKNKYEAICKGEEKKQGMKGFMDLPAVAAALKIFEDVESLFKIEFDLGKVKEKKKIDSLSSAVKTVFLNLIQSPIFPGEVKTFLASKMFYLCQTIASAIGKFDNKKMIELQQESLIYLTYGYGLALSEGSAKAFDERLLRSCIVDNRLGGKGGVLSPDDLDEEFSKKETLEFFINNVLNPNHSAYWLIEREEDFMAFARGAVNLFIGEQIREFIANKVQKIKDTKKDLDRLLKKRAEMEKEMGYLEDKELEKFKKDLSQCDIKIKVVKNNLESMKNNLKKLKDYLPLTSIKDLKKLKNSLRKRDKKDAGSKVKTDFFKDDGGKKNLQKENILVIINTIDRISKLHKQIKKEEIKQERLYSWLSS